MFDVDYYPVVCKQKIGLNKIKYYFIKTLSCFTTSQSTNMRKLVHVIENDIITPKEIFIRIVRVYFLVSTKKQEK